MNVLGEVLPIRKLSFLASCAALVLLPYLLMDRADVWLLVMVMVAVWVLAVWLNPAYRRHLRWFLTGMGLFFVIGEIAFRVLVFGWPGLSFSQYRPADYGHPWSLFEYDASTYTGLKPSTSLNFRGAEFRTNREGFRGKDYPREKPAGTIRVVMAGASVTLGSGLEEEELLPSRLEKKLNEAGLPQRVEVLNLSVGGGNYGTQLHVLREVGLTYQPDLLLFLANEKLIPGRPMEIRARKVHKVDVSTLRKIMHRRFSFFSMRFFFANLIRDHRAGTLAAARPEGADEALHQHTAMQQENLQRAFDEWTTLQNQSDAEMVLYIIRPLSNLQDPEERGAFRRYLREQAASRGFHVVDTYYADFKGYKPLDLAVYPGDKHPNGIAQEIFAAYMAPRLEAIIRGRMARRHSAPGTP